MFTKRLKSALCAFLSVSIAMTTLPAPMALAQTSGPDQRATANVGGTLVSFPKLTWRRLGAVDAGDDRARGGSAPAASSLESALNTAGEALGLNQRDVATVLTAVPENQAFVLGRTDNYTQTGRVDLFKVQRTGTVAELLHARFTPEHGMAWVASRTYLTASERSNPAAVGRNPFASFDDGSGNFKGVSVAGMAVAVGHAMQLAGTSNGLIVEIKVQQPKQWTTKSGRIRKKVTTHVEYYGKPAYYFASPIASAAQAQAVPAYCLTSISGASAGACPDGLLAGAGSTFEQVAGGNLDETKTFLAHEQETKKSWGGLAMFLVGLAVASIMGPVMPFELTTVLGGGATAIGRLILGNASTTVNGYGIDRNASGLGQAGESLGNETTLRELLESRRNPGNQLPGYIAPGKEDNRFTQALGRSLRERNIGDTPAMFEPARNAILGTCPLGATAADCASMGIGTGMIERSDQRSALKHLQIAEDTLEPEAVRPDSYFGDRTERAVVERVPMNDPRSIPNAYQDVPASATYTLEPTPYYSDPGTGSGGEWWGYAN